MRYVNIIYLRQGVRRIEIVTMCFSQEPEKKNLVTLNFFFRITSLAHISPLRCMFGVPGTCRGLCLKSLLNADAKLPAVCRRVLETIGTERCPLSRPSASQAAVRLRLMNALLTSSCSTRDRAVRKGS